jgi:tetratricopeptide (TPR) repeat protein
LLPEIYADWVLPARLALRETFLQRLAQLGAVAAAQLRWADAASHYRRLAHADPLNETAQLGLMQSLAALGRVAEALNDYEQFRAAMARELGAPPTAETRALAEHLQRELDLSRSIAASAERPPPPFVGRAAERAAALAAVEAALAGRGSLIAIEGEAGIGKSRLLDEITAGARWRGASVSLGRASEYPAATPLAPLAELLTAALDGVRMAQIEALLTAEVRAALGLLLSRWLDSTDETELPWADARRRFHRAWVTLLESLASLAPHILLLDDVHWATPAVWEALDAVVPVLAGQRLLLVVAYRRPAIEQTPGWAFVQRWEREAGLRVLALPPFSSAEVRLLLPSSQGDQATDIHALTGGNPFLLTEALANLEAGRAPAGDAMLARVGLLPPTAAAALQSAAVLGSDVPYALWARVAGLPPLTLARASEQLVAERLLKPEGQGYRFAHDLVRDAVYETLPTEGRRQLHYAVAEALAALDPDNLSARAFHLDQAGASAEAATAYCLAGHQVQGRLAYAEARAAFERALQLLPATAMPERVETLLALARVCDALGARDRQHAAVTEALAGARVLSDRTLLTQALLRSGRLAAQTGRLREAAECYGEALGVATETGDVDQQSEATFLLGELANRQGLHVEAERYYHSVLAQARQTGHQGRMARAMRGLGLVARRGGRPAEAATWFEQALAVQQAIHDRGGEAVTRTNLMSTYYDLNAWDRLLALTDETLALCTALSRQESLAMVRHLKGLALVALGDFGAAHQWLTAALELYEGLNDWVAAGLTRNALGLVAEAVGDLAKAESEYRAALATAEALGATTEAAYARHDLGALRLGLGDAAGARPALEAARAKWQELGNDLLRLKSEAVLGLACQAMGDRARAIELAERGWKAFEQGPISGEQPQGWLWPLQALLDNLGRAGQAEAVLRGAYAELQRQGQAIADTTLRRQLFDRVPLNRAIVEAHDRQTQTQRRRSVRLARAAAALGRRLGASDYVDVTWTVQAPDDELISTATGRRRHVLRRLLDEAQAQGGSPTDDDLAQVLGVSRRTIERDMSALQAAGLAPATRRRKTS